MPQYHLFEQGKHGLLSRQPYLPLVFYDVKLRWASDQMKYQMKWTRDLGAC